MQRMDPNGDGIVDEVEKRAFARSTAKLRASNMKYKKGFGAALALLALAWIGNAVLMMVIVNLSKVGDSLFAHSRVAPRRTYT